MAIELPTDEESTGPLDASKAAGYETGINPPDIEGESHHSGAEKLDLSSATGYQNSADVMHEKNPLGYTVTSLTADEIDEGETADDVVAASQV